MDKNNILMNTSDSLRPFSSICSVEYNCRNGTGFIVVLEFPEGTWRTMFMTSFQVAPIKDLNDIAGLKLVFKDSTIGNLSLTPNWVKTLWTSSDDELDVTIIELSTVAMTIISRTNITRLVSATPRDNERILIYQFLGSELNNLSGSIDNIKGKTIEYSANTSSESPGSPLLTYDFKVIGLESKRGAMSNKWNAIDITKIFESYRNELKMLYSSQTENEIWLQRIKKTKDQHGLKIIGSGGYGKVYKMTESDGNVLALKIVEGICSLDGFESQVRAIKEYQLVMSLELHPRIIQFFQFVQNELKFRLMIVMEYLEGGSLHDKIKSKGSLDKPTSLKYLTQILEAVCFLHKNNIYHSDIKPENILLTSNEDIKLCDFGIAVCLRTESSATSSHAKIQCDYMSPERLDRESRSPENDIWSVGATFVTMITGKPLNDGEGYLKKMLNIVQYQILIDSKPMKEYLESLYQSDYKRQIISRTLCKVQDRAKSHELMELIRKLSLDHDDQQQVQLNESVRPSLNYLSDMGQSSQTAVRPHTVETDASISAGVNALPPSTELLSNEPVLLPQPLLGLLSEQSTQNALGPAGTGTSILPTVSLDVQENQLKPSDSGAQDALIKVSARLHRNAAVLSGAASVFSQNGINVLTPGINLTEALGMDLAAASVAGSALHTTLSPPDIEMAAVSQSNNMYIFLLTTPPDIFPPTQPVNTFPPK